MNLVRDRMSAPAVTVGTNTPIAEILRIFDRGALTAVPVVDDEGRLAGVVSTSDVIRRLVKRLDDHVPARELMSAPPVVAAPGEALDLAAWRLVAARARRLVVIEDDRPVGVLSVDDVLGGLLHRHVRAPLRSIMSTSLEALHAGDSIGLAIERLATSGVHGLVVLDGRGPVGVFGHAEALAARRLPPLLLQDPVDEVMCREIVTLDGETPIDRAARHAWSTHARRVLVQEKEQLVGVVSDLDLVEALVRSIDQAAAS
jgi:predicted transcriptional regulator